MYSNNIITNVQQLCLQYYEHYSCNRITDIAAIKLHTATIELHI